MTGRRSKRKGYRGEKLFAELVGGQRIPASGVAHDFPNDVILPNGWRAEVKWRKDGFAQLYKWLESDPPPDILAIKADRKPFLVVIPEQLFLEILGRRAKNED